MATNKRQILICSIFGEPLESFDPLERPTALDVVRLWLFLYDKARGAARQMSPKKKTDVIHLVKTAVIDNWTGHGQGLSVLPDKNVFDKVRCLVTKVEKIGHFVQFINNLKWIEEKRMEFMDTFDIGMEPEPSDDNSENEQDDEVI